MQEVRPVARSGSLTRDEEKKLAADQAESDARVLVSERDLKDYRKRLLSGYNAMCKVLGKTMDRLEAKYITEFGRYLLTKDPLALLQMLKRHWKEITPTVNKDTELRDMRRQVEGIPRDVNPAGLYQHLTIVFAGHPNADVLMRYEFMAMLDSAAFAQYNTKKNAFTAAGKDLAEVSLEALADQLTQGVFDQRAEAEALSPPVTTQRALAAVPLKIKCSFCGRPNHKEEACREQQGAIQVMMDARHQAKAAPKSTRRPASDT